MMHYQPVKLQDSPVTRLCDFVLHPIDAFASVIRDLLHRFKSKRHKAVVVEASNQTSTSHSNLSESENVAVTTYVQPSHQAATCLMLGHTLWAFLIGCTKGLDLILFQVLVSKLLAITILVHKFPLFSPILILLPRLCDFAHGHFKTCTQTGQSSKAPSRQRRRAEKRQDKKGKQRDDNRDGNGDDPGDEGNDDNRKPDGLRFPIFDFTSRLFDCPFHKHDPVRYQGCKGYLRFCDLKQHIERQHVLRKDKYHCSRCRIEFVHGDDPGASYETHMRAHRPCLRATIEETGVILPGEYDTWKQGFLSSNEHPVIKWQKIWINIFRGVVPCPYVEDLPVTMMYNYYNVARMAFPQAIENILERYGYPPNEELAREIIQQTIDILFPPQGPPHSHLDQA
ncbi:hypothetical protein NCS52_01403600 [Fusarium sp. LHS14.1]|nr:hypothetical protein NCS52_01403600 [Fusarium sp. LHS14.1]